MNRKKMVVIVASAVAVASIFTAFAFWRYQAPADPGLLVAIVYDRSWSPIDGCASVVGLVEHELEAAADKKQDFELLLLATGDSATANEPITRHFKPLQYRHKIQEGRSRREKEINSFLKEVHKQCLGFPRTEISPILLAVKEASAQLQTMGAQLGTETRLDVVSDLEENVDKDIMQALRGSTKPYRASAAVSNSGMPTLLCGYAQTAGNMVDSNGHVRQLTGARSVEQTERLRRVWTRTFTNPKLVTLEPFCPETVPENLTRLIP